MHAIVRIEFLEGLFKGVFQRQLLQHLEQVFIVMAFKSLSVINPTLLEEFTISSMGKTTFMNTNLYQRLPRRLYPASVNSFKPRFLLNSNQI